MNESVNVKTRLSAFPIEIVKSITSSYNKAFHSKIFTLFASSVSELYTFAKIHPQAHYTYCFAFMKNDEGQWYLNKDDILKVKDYVLRQAKENPKTIFDLHESWKKEWEKYLKLSDELLDFDLGKLSDTKLLEKFEEFYNQYLLVGSVAYMADSFMSTGTEDWLEVLISKELEDAGLQKHKIKEKVCNLTSPVHFSFTLESEHQLMKIAQLLGEIVPFDELPSKITVKLEEHSRKFHWIQNNYYNVKFMSSRDFYEQVKEIIKETGDEPISAVITRKEKEINDLRKDKEHLIEHLDLSSYARNILEIAGLFSKWKDDRKSGVYIGMYFFDKFLKEISLRTEYSKRQLNLLIFNEIIDLIKDKKDFSGEISKREKQCFFAVTDKGYFIEGGENTDKYFNIFEGIGTKDVTELKGVVACQGHARGRVHIIRKTEEMKEFKTGEILVTNQTTPEFVPIMKKAAAIITEQGGITSHAAIVSREMKKPCIIGTKIATTALKNNEIVEVDAYNGVIRKMR